MLRCSRRIWLLFIFLLLGWLPPMLSDASARAAAVLPLQQLSTTMVGQPIAAGDYLFWLDRRAGGTIYGYQRSQSRSFVVAALGPAVRVTQLTSDGRTLAWLDLGSTVERIQRYDLQTQMRSSIALPSRRPAIADMTLVDGVLYYWDAAPDHRGIFAHYLATGQERQLRSLPRVTGRGRLMVADDVLVWSEYTAQGAFLPPRATLYLYRLGSDGEQIVVRGQAWSGALSGFDLAGPWLVWAFTLERQVWLYNLQTGAREIISRDAAARPQIHGTTVVWDVDDPAAQRSTLALYSLTERRHTPITTTGSAYLAAQALPDAHTLLFSVDRRPTLRNELYLAPLPHAGTPLVAPIAGHAVNRSSAPAPPAGQIRVAGRGFIVEGAPDVRWTFNGVHLILPSHGINGSSFGSVALSDPHAAVERRVWLDRAQQIGVQTVRIYVDMPGDAHVATPPRPVQLFEFARDELAPRGMRLGLVIHNSGRFDDPDGHKMAWLRALLDCFGGVPNDECATSDRVGSDQSALLAYINADNEINIHRQPLNDLIPGNPNCLPDDPRQPPIAEDCFDHPNPEKRQRYIEQAVGWVALVRSTIEQHPTGQQVLLTVGMSVDLDKDVLGDGQSAVLNYFVPVPNADGGTHTLADLVDFIAPHSYTAMPHWEIGAPIERNAPLFSKPIVLEEFGYPTDPLAQPDPAHPAEFKETSLDVQQRDDGGLEIVVNRRDLPPGEDINKLCRYLPKLGTYGERPKRCQPSAPYVVQANLEAIFEMQQFAGGIAFMLADSHEKNDGSKQCYAADEQHQLSKNVFLGLFAIDDQYRCGGTVNVGAGQIKNTGYRVCVAYRTGNPQRGNYRDRVPECALDLPPTPTPTQPTVQPTSRPSIAPPMVTPTPVAVQKQRSSWWMPGGLVVVLLVGGCAWWIRRRL